MTEPITQSEIIAHLHRLEQAVVDRVTAERSIAADFGVSVDPRVNELRQQLVDLDSTHHQRLTDLDAQHQERRREVENRLDTELNAAVTERRDARNIVEKQAIVETDDITTKHDDSRWVAESVLDETSEDSPKRQFDAIREALDNSKEQQQVALESLHVDVQAAMDDRNWSREPPAPPEEWPKKLADLSQLFAESVDSARTGLVDLKKLKVPRLFVGMRPLWLFILLMLGTGLPAYLLVEPAMVGVTGTRTDGSWIGMLAGAALLTSLLLLTVLYTISSMQLSDVFGQMLEHKTNARFYHEQWKTISGRERSRQQKAFEAKQAKMGQQLQGQLKRFAKTHQQTIDEIETRRQDDINEIERDLKSRQADFAQRRVTELQTIDNEHRQQQEVETAEYETTQTKLNNDLEQHTAGRMYAHEQSIKQMANAWNQSLYDVAVAKVAAQQERQASAPEWSAVVGDDWQPSTAIPSHLGIGDYSFDLSRLANGIPTEDSLIPSQSEFRFPAALPFPEGASLLLKTDGPDSRRAAVQAMQVYLLRMLTQMPPGKLRLTIFDPVGLGESFSGLMHLADYDELLITSRIWTETAQIEARLADLTGHMENVLQKYLRNEFSSIEAYNEFAGEVAEPYHVLVIADFPNKFSEQAARRLTSIATSGPRCGVYLLMSADPQQPTPHGFDLADITHAATSFVWGVPRPLATARDRTPVDASASTDAQPPDGNQTAVGRLSPDDIDRSLEALRGETSSDGPFSEQHENGNRDADGNAKAFHLETTDDALARCPLMLDEPPSPALFTQIVKTIGEASKDVRRVEVSFGRIAPSSEDVWTQDSRRGIDIPLGRAGALKLQHLRLGKGTSQHMLVAGKTGSGKSTFFHALITNAALHYSPDELQLYLVDFKKGVEFKAYAGGKLPHARVIAIESDREFGISVLQRLDAIMNERGERFREAGVQDVASWRDRESGVKMPRILLVIDEFQEFFLEDDRYSQQAAMLLDRLVRQGRAFGVHVILGSQTLGGAYSLARSTLGQVAVRVALQCSEADAHLILSEENTAARLLTRPGEAIYNDSNGTVEGNHPFQIAWLPDEERAGYLSAMQVWADERGLSIPPAIVFEGNIPSDPSRNEELTQLIETTADRTRETQEAEGSIATTSSTPTRLWLGEAVEIGPPTFVSFPQQAGSNLLIIGQDPAAATGILSTGYIALASQLGPTGVEMTVEESPCEESAGGESTGEENIDQENAEDTEDRSAAVNKGVTQNQVVTPLWIFNGGHVGSPEADYWKQLAGLRPESTRIVTPGNLKPALETLAAERLRREELVDAASQPSVFVLVNNLSKFRDLRKGDDEFSFGGFGSQEAEKPADPSKQFADLIAKGPEVGLHVLVWVDSANNLDRWLSRQSLKEFELRVLFTMNAGDSSNLIDSPSASRLGPHRALLYREETGSTTKFRPYGPPSEDWLNVVRRHLWAIEPLESIADLDSFRVI